MRVTWIRDYDSEGRNSTLVHLHRVYGDSYEINGSEFHVMKNQIHMFPYSLNLAGSLENTVLCRASHRYGQLCPEEYHGALVC